MGILDSAFQQGLEKLGVGGLGSTPVTPKFLGPDFSEFKIVEIVDGKELTKDAIILAGSFMPFQPFEFGGTQQIVKDYYPGNSEPVVQVLGSRENDTTIRGRFRTKRFKDKSLRQAAQEYQELIDAVRLRGNLVKLTLGEWRRYGFIEECNFKLNRLADIEYEIKFVIIGINPPSDLKFIADPKDSPIEANKQLTAAALAFLQSYKSYPSSMPKSLSDTIDGLVSEIATKINLVTSFVDSIVGDAEKLVSSVNRAVGLIKNAKYTVANTIIRLEVLKKQAANVPKQLGASGTLKNYGHIHQIERGNTAILAYLATLQKKMEAFSTSVPAARHLVRSGDTLQSLAIKYYQNADNWKKIYDHNKLVSTELVVGRVLEIPKA